MALITDLSDRREASTYRHWAIIVVGGMVVLLLVGLALRLYGPKDPLPPLLDGGFELTKKLGHWRNDTSCQLSVQKDASAHAGRAFLVVRAVPPCEAIAQDINLVASQNQGYTFSAWLRTPTGDAPTGSLVIEGGALVNEEFSAVEQQSTPFRIVGNEWQCVQTTLHVADPTTTQLRAAIAFSSPNGEYHLDDLAFDAGESGSCPTTP